jgi:hypothetical protein
VNCVDGTTCNGLGQDHTGNSAYKREAAALLANLQARVNCVDGTACNGLGLGSDQVTARSLKLFVS